MQFRTLIKRPVDLLAEFTTEIRKEASDCVRGCVEDIGIVATVAPDFAKAALGGVSTAALAVMDLGAISMTVQGNGGRFIPAVAAVALSVAIYDSAKRIKRNFSSGVAKMDQRIDGYARRDLDIPVRDVAP